MNDNDGYDAWRDGALSIPGLHSYEGRHAARPVLAVPYCLMTPTCPCVTCERERALWNSILTRTVAS